MTDEQRPWETPDETLSEGMERARAMAVHASLTDPGHRCERATLLYYALGLHLGVLLRIRDELVDERPTAALATTELAFVQCQVLIEALHTRPAQRCTCLDGNTGLERIRAAARCPVHPKGDHHG